MSDNKAVFRRLLDATNSHDAAVIAAVVDEVCHPDMRFAAPPSIASTGAAAIKEVFARLHDAFPDLRIEVEDLVEEGDTVVSRHVVTGTHRGAYLGVAPTGRTVTYQEMFVLRFVDGRIAETSGVVDVLSQMTQLGIVPVPPKEKTMTARLDIPANVIAMKFARHLVAASKVIADSTLPATTRELVSLRASQLNGCSYCVDMHTKDAAHAGESQVRINLVAVWREATVFTEAERAALELTEQGTRIAAEPEGVTDEAWANAAKHYDEDQLGALVSLITLINSFNRLNVITRQPAGDYQPGQWH